MLLQHAGRGLIAAFDVGSCDSIFASYVSSAVLKGGGDRFVIVLAFRLPSLQVISFFYTGIKQKQAEIVGQPEKGKK